jgi:hypothetical protein
MKTARKILKKKSNRVALPPQSKLLLLPLFFLSLLSLIQLHFWFIPCDSGFFIGGCGLGMMAIYSFALYEIIVYAFCCAVFIALQILKGLPLRPLSLATVFIFGVVVTMFGIVGLFFLHPLTYLFTYVFEMIFTAFEKGYLPGFLLSSLHY